MYDNYKIDWEDWRKIYKNGLYAMGLNPDNIIIADYRISLKEAFHLCDLFGFQYHEDMDWYLSVGE